MEGLDMLIKAKGSTRLIHFQTLEQDQLTTQCAMSRAGPMTATSWYTQRIQMNEATIQLLLACDTRLELVKEILTYLRKFNACSLDSKDKKYLTDRISRYEKLLQTPVSTKKPSKPRKKTIPKRLKEEVWTKYIGPSVGQSKCLCCKINDITQMSFHCGHVVAEANGGETNLFNLRPICSKCNLSMGTQHMDEFMKLFR
jgi:hypothetical protein